VKLRPAALVVALAAAVALLLSGCGPAKTGAAAIVGDTQISMSDINGYVVELDENQLASSGFTSSQAQTAASRSLVLRFVIGEEVSTQALKELGLDPTPAELEAAHDEGITLVLGSNPQNLSGDAADAELASELEQVGVSADFLDVFLRYAEQMAILADALHVTSLSAVGSAIDKMGIDVQVNPRFGEWSFQTMDVVGGPVVPSFVTTGGSTDSPVAAG
jgi:hypothetical protein